MIIRKYGIELRRLEASDIELVRKMRNLETIRAKMFYQKEITPEEQVKWFHSINNHRHYYFIIHYKDEKIGMIHGKIRSFETREAEGGMFIWKREYLSSHIPVLASICLADLTFLVMKMNATLAEVRSDNHIALDYNHRLGYQIIRTEGDKVEMRLTKEDYLHHAGDIRAMVKKITNDPSDLSWGDLIMPEEKGELYTGYPDYIQQEIDKKR